MMDCGAKPDKHNRGPDLYQPARRNVIVPNGRVVHLPSRMEEMPVSSFEAESQIQQIAEAYSLDMIDYAKQIGVELDWSDESIQNVEDIAEALHAAYRKDHPTPEQIEPLYKMIGSYIGEVFRRNHGAEWGWVTLQGSRFPGMEGKADNLFWPWGRARNRIIKGSEDNLWHYYQYLLEGR